MTGAERAQVKALQRERKLRVLDHLARHGESSLTDLAGAAEATEQETRAIVMRLIRGDVVLNTSRRVTGKPSSYRLWTDVIADLRAKQRPTRDVDVEPLAASGWTVA